MRVVLVLNTLAGERKVCCCAALCVLAGLSLDYSFDLLETLEYFSNDPSAGSPTETLLRLLLPLNDQVRLSFQHAAATVASHSGANPRASLNHSIGSSDGRCVQRAGT